MNFEKIFVQNKNIKLKPPFRKFRAELKKDKPELLKKKYFCLSVWSIACPPCLSEIPHLVSLFQAARSDIALLFVSQFSEKACLNILKMKNIDSKDMILINNMNDLISGIYNELDFRTQVFPMHLVVDNKANPLAFITGNIENPNDSARLMNFIKNLL